MRSKIIKKLKSFLSYSLKLFILASFLISQSFIAEIFLYQNHPNTKSINTAKAGASDSWYNTSWLYRKQITVDHTKVLHTDAGNINPYLSDFPFLVSANIPINEVRSDYNDIVFIDQTGLQVLSYEIESYDTTNGNLIAWVKLPQMNDANNTTDTIFYMYYDNSSAASSQQNKATVWDAGFKGVWHLGENPTGHAVGDYKDSTSPADNSANTTNTPVHNGNGQIGGAQTFNGTSNRIDFGKSVVNLNTNFTIDWWSMGIGDGVIGSISSNKVFVRATNFGILGQYNSVWRTYAFIPATLNTSLWHHYVLTLAGTSLKGYLDGTQVNELSVDAATAVNVWFIGMNNYWPNYFNGNIDEMRVSTTARSADWVKAEYNNDANTSGFYTLGGKEDTTPTFSPVAGTYSSSQTVSIVTSLPGSIIYYTADGTEPTAGSSVYATPLVVVATTTVKAIAVAAGYTSAVGSGLFTIQPPTAIPTFSPVAGTYNSTQAVTISTTTPNATIYYTTDGSNPTISSALYGIPLSVASATTIKAIAIASGYSTSDVGSGIFTILPFATTPVFSPGAGTYPSAKDVTISTTTPNATIYYTTDGSNPTTSSNQYVGPVTVASTTPIKAIATSSGYATSPPVSGLFTINASATEVKYGFWGMGLSPSSYQPNWNNVTHIAYHYWNTNANGTLVNPADMSIFNAVRDVAHQHGVKILMGLVSNPSNLDEILANHRQDFADNLLSALQSYGADGVNFDFENSNSINTITQTSNGPLFEDMVRLVNIKLKSANPEYLIVGDTPERTYGFFSSSTLKAYLDYVFIMGYDYSLPNSSKAGPVSPYSDSTRYDITETVSQFSNLYDKKQIILGLPLYGYNWTVVSNQMGATTSGTAGSLTMGSAINSADTYGRIWDPISHTPWYRYQVGSTWHQVWYDDEESLRLKYDFIKSQNLAGVGFWALPYEQGHPEVLDNVFLNQHHTLTVANGSGSYVQGQTVAITANAPAAGKTFDRWTGDTNYVSDVDSLSTVITEMPNADINLTATYKDALNSWYDPAWSCRKAITINHGKVSADQADFPVFLSITDPALKTVAPGGEVHSVDGYDVLFVSSTGQRLDYEIEKYDLATGEMGVWIRIPILSSAQDTIIYLYYGNSNIVSSQENKTNVWDNQFKGVWHMNGSATGHAGDFKDSTINANNNSNATNEPIATTGQMAGAQTFNGISSRIDLGKVVASLNTSFTIEWWSKGTGGGVIGSNSANRVYVGGSSFGIIGNYNSTWHIYSFNPAYLDASIWHHYSLVLNGNKLDGYLDGVSVNELTVDISTWVGVWYIGMNAYWPDYFSGSIDEVRISDTTRSADWIKTEYNNQSSPSTFSSFSSEETLPTITSLSANLPNGTYGTGTTIPITINFSKDVTSTGNITLTLNTIPQRSCSFTVTNNNSATCNYTIQSGDSATNLNATISGTIQDQFGNPMINFTPTSSLSDSTIININTLSSPFIPPIKPNITNIDITVLDNGTTTFNLPSNITQIAISRTPDFANVSWQDFDQDKLSHINETQETLYLKFRTNEGAVSDVIIITPQTNINNPISLIDGDIIQCKSSNDPNAVYIVKIIGNKTYIRHITSVRIFNYYKHLKWENLKQVDSLTPFSLSSWIRVNTGTNGLSKAGDKVYEINGDQTKHWINMTASQFLSHGGSDEAIYTVNTGELNLYSAGADVVSL